MSQDAFITALTKAFPGIESDSVEYDGTPEDLASVTVFLDDWEDVIIYEDWELEIERVGDEWEYRVADEDGDLVTHGRVGSLADAPAEARKGIEAN